MPIEVDTGIQVLDQEAFHALDRRIMGLVFDVHNEFGPLLDEEVYKIELAARCAEAGIEPVEQEVKIRVSHQSFRKDYSMDLLLCRGFMLEAKVAEALVAAHRAQALNYLLLAGLRHGRLVNFGTQRAQHEFVSTTLTHDERRRFTIEDREWKRVNAGSQTVRAKTIELLRDLGGFLDANLYRDALVHFLGGSAVVSREVEVRSGPRGVGVQRWNLLDQNTALAVTTKQKGIGVMRHNLERLLGHTKLEYIQWVNFNRHRVEFTTLRAHHCRRNPEIVSVVAGQSDGESGQGFDPL